MAHVTDGALRRALDEPASLSDADRAHLAGCPRCGSEVAAAAQDRNFAGAALAAEGTGAEDVEAAWSRLAARAAEPPAPTPAPAPARVPVARPRRGRLRNPVVAGVAAAALVIGGTAAAAAADWLPIFRTEAVAPLTVSMADVSQLSQLAGLAGLEDYGNVTGATPPRITAVGDADQARRRTGLAVPAVGALPAGVTGKPAYLVVEHQTASFTFSAAKAAKAARVSGALPPLPAGLDGSTLRLDVGPGVGEAWWPDGGAGGMPQLLVARAQAPTVSAQGASLAEVRDYLLSIPGIPTNLARQLKAMSTDGTLPIPVLTGQASSAPATVGGVPATVLTGASGQGSAVVWVRDGQLGAVLGTLPSGTLVRVADDLR